MRTNPTVRSQPSPRTLNATIGPSNKVIGARITLGNATDVSHSRFTPCSESTWCVKNGLSPCANAYGFQRKNHMNFAGSPGSPIHDVLGEAHARENSNTARPVYMSSAAIAGPRRRLETCREAVIIRCCYEGGFVAWAEPSRVERKSATPATNIDPGGSRGFTPVITRVRSARKRLT